MLIVYKTNKSADEYSLNILKKNHGVCVEFSGLLK